MNSVNNDSATKMKEKIKYVPFQSSIDASFWLKVSNHKLHHMRLNEGPVPIRANFARSPPTSRTNEIEIMQQENNVFLPPRMRMDHNSLLDKEGDESIEIKSSLVENETVACPGILYVYNTLEAFKRVNKKELLNQHIQQLSPLFKETSSNRTEDQNLEKYPTLEALNSILIASFLDLKKHKVVYWCAFPALATVSGASICYSSLSLISSIPSDALTKINPLSSYTALPQHISLSSILTKDRHDELALAFHSMRISLLLMQQTLTPYFLIENLFSESSIQCIPLFTYLASSKTMTSTMSGPILAFLDPSNDPHNPGWPLRNLLAYSSLSPLYRNLQETIIPIISFRPSTLRRISLEILSESDTNANNTPSYQTPVLEHNSSLFSVMIPPTSHYDWKTSSSPNPSDPQLQLLGWEKNPQNKLSPRVLSLASLLSPAHLANTAVNLNLSLLKWRQIPNLKTDLLSQTKCLLLGAGTLGCNVARILLGWGIQDITFVDNGKVTYSNPARQNLFTIKNVNEEKAPVAAKALREIVPGVKSRGFTLNIPMPGHDLKGGKEWEDYVKLKELVKECDVVFLLTDTRESRWLPTLLAKFEKKILINAALGLDTYLVMRHGFGKNDVNVSDLGCYFCNDVVAPENSTRERTLDQQCTVTRPGLAPIAGSLAVEMMVALLHHEENKKTQQNKTKKKDSTDQGTVPSRTPSRDTSALGYIPHQIRGSLSSHTLMTPTVPAFPHCTACSDPVLKCFEDIGDDLLRKVCSTGPSISPAKKEKSKSIYSGEGVEFLENLTGLKDFRDEIGRAHV